MAEQQIGPTIKTLRKEKALTLQTVANRSGLSKGFLSKVERGVKSPAVSTLSRIAQAIGVQISDFFTMEEPAGDIVLVKSDQRQIISRDHKANGYYYESVAHPFGQKLMEPFILTFVPHPPSTHMFTHDGEEMIYVLKGRMRFLHGDKEFVAEEGDTLYFNSKIPHRGECLENEETQVLIVMVERNQGAAPKTQSY